MARSPHRQRLDRAPGMPGDPREVAAARWRALDRASTDRRLNDLDVRALTYVVSKRLNGESGLAFPSAETAAGDLGIESRSWFRVTKRLEATGYLRGYRVPGKTTAYSLVWQRFSGGPVTEESQVLDAAADQGGPGASSGAEGMTAGSRGSDSGVTGPVTVGSLESTEVNPLPSTPPTARAREADDGDVVEGQHAAEDAARRVGPQQVDQRTVDRHPANDDPGPTLSELEEHRRHTAKMASRFGAWGWWNCDYGGRVTLPPGDAVEVDPDFAEAVLAYQHGEATWTIREVDGARFVDKSTGSRPTPAEVTAFAEALAAGEAEAVAVADRLTEVAKVEAEVDARHLAARLEARAVGDDELVLALFVEDPELRLAAEARAAALAASWGRRIAAEPARLAALPPAASMSNAELIEAARIVCDVRGWDAGDLARVVGLPAHALGAFLEGGHQRINPAGHARLRPWIAARQAGRAAA